MDVIGRAIKRNSQKLNDKKWQNTGWNNFEAQIVNKKLFLFGVGPGVDFYYHKYGESANADGVIDNDRNLSGTRLQDWIVEKVDNELESKCAIDPKHGTGADKTVVKEYFKDIHFHNHFLTAAAHTKEISDDATFL